MVTHNDLTWLVYIIDLPDQNIEAWHDSSTFQIHPRLNIGLQYIRNTSEYILKLHIHQHSLLTRKVFFRHNFQHWSSVLYHWIMFIFKSSSLDLDHHRTSSQDLDHHSIWIIITESRSSLDLDHHHWTGSGSSLDLDHHCWIWIITRSESLRVIITGSGS